MSCLPLALLLASPLFGQLQLSVVTSSGERPAGAQYNAGTVPGGESADIRFRIRNAAPASQNVQRISVAGAGFSIANAPPLPYVLASGAAADFTVRFQPSGIGSYSASLTVNTTDVLLTGTGIATATLRGIPNGATIDFGRAERGARIVKRLALENVFPAPVTVRDMRVSGAGFIGPSAIGLPVTVPAQSAVEFEITFQPPAAGSYTGTLEIEQRSYKLAGAAVNPPNPKPVIVVDPGPLPSAAQGRAGIRFESPARLDGKGTLQLDLRPDAANASDPAVVFVTGSRAVEFTFREGDTEARFVGLAVSPVQFVAFQTGTTAGSLVFTAQLGEYKEQTAVTVTPAAIGIQAVLVSRTSFNAIVDVTGYDNTRTASQITFTFTNTSGSTLPAIRYDASADFRKYFESSTTGGAFLLHAVFPVTGNSAEIASVEIEMVNSAGTSRSGKTSF